MVKNAVRDRLPFPLLIRLYYFSLRFRYYPVYEASRRRLGAPLLDSMDLWRYKTSDTLFVLGSGPSINRISAQRWEAIARHDSVGFNFWPYHRFVPTFYFFESGRNHAQGEAYHKMAAARAEEYRNVPKVLMDLCHPGYQYVYDLPAGWRENLYVAYTIPAIARTDEEFGYVVRLLKKRGAFAPESRIRYLLKHCATLSTLVTLGAKLQYKRIVLCGVDLTTNEYYYQDPELYPESKDVELVPRARKHATLTRYCWGNTPIDVVLEELRRQVLEPAGIELYLEHDGSALYPRIPRAPEWVFAAGVGAAYEGGAR
ncbi:MAG: hypothetical protein ACE14L_04125 [Terriglobales bacterium]